MTERFRPLIQLVRRMRLPRLLLGGACALTVLDTAAGLYVPLLTRDLIEAAGGAGVPRRMLWRLVAVVVVQAALSGAAMYLLARAGERMTAFLRNALIGRLLRLPMSFHDEQRSGELVSRAMSDTTTVKSLLAEHSVAFVASLLSLVGSVVILWLLDWRLTLVLFLTSLAGLLLVLPVAARLQEIGHQTQGRLAELSGRLTSILGEMRLLKASCAEAQEERCAAGAVDGLRRLGLREARIMAVLGPTVTLALSGSLVVILAYGGTRVASGTLTVGTLVAFILYLFQVVMPMVQLSTFVAALNKALGAAAHLSALLEEREEDRAPDGRVPTEPATVVFRGVTHGYAGGVAVLHDLDLEIPCGRVTALVGPSGGGKTTILALLERFYSPTTGVILHGDHSISRFALEPWRRRIGYVPQEAPLLGGTVRENLCFGLGRAPSDEEIENALRAARADELVAALPRGLDTEVGERGLKLSGGQRQRLAIARAFLVDPEILMLDEATANLDSESEAALRAGLAELMRGRTTLIVAHRLSTVLDADQIVVLEAGRITGRGTHEELLARHTVYRSLVEGQSMGPGRRLAGAV
ncbi:MAG TPA: ABC transporter ATP-binding protein [Thermoanaerobaculia bacterium]|nr:ABC transporter ATP-binding protein [Thermoanaerobaculia bacterium]